MMVTGDDIVSEMEKNRGTKSKSKFKPIIATSYEKAMTARAEALFSTGQVTCYSNYKGQVFHLKVIIMVRCYIL